MRNDPASFSPGRFVERPALLPLRAEFELLMSGLPMKHVLLLLLMTVPAFDCASAATRLVEPQMRLQAASRDAAPRVALTFDACSGLADQRILSTLVENRIPATVFVTGRWLKRNAQTLAVFKAHPDLFEIENHGAMHVPAIDRAMTVYGIATAGSAEAVAAEVSGGAAAILGDGVTQPRWFRGATAKYTPSSIGQIRHLGYRVAGYSLNGDGGSLFGAPLAERKIAAARDGDVIIAHINQPSHAAGEGVAKGILDLKAKGFVFVTLNDADEDGNDDTTN